MADLIMKLISLSQEEQSKYDLDSLVYLSDTEFAYSEAVPKSVVEDILNHEMMYFGGFYHYSKGDDSPRIFLLCRGIRRGQSIVEV